MHFFNWHFFLSWDKTELENVLWLTWPDFISLLKGVYSPYYGLYQVKNVAVHYEFNIFK